MPGRQRDRPWVVLFILFSLLAHLLFVLGIVLVSHFVPAPKLPPPAPPSSTTLSLQTEPPPSPKTPSRPKRQFIPTLPDKNAQHKELPLISDNDSALHSKSREARDKESLLPDARQKRKDANVTEAPHAPSPEPPKPADISATGRDTQGQQAAKPAPQAPPQPQPKPQAAQQPSPTQAPQPSTTPPKPAKPETAKVQYDPNGLPLLPALNAPTIAPASQHQDAAPAASIPQIQQDTHGAVGSHGEDSPAAMATEFGRYKAKFWRAVGSQWYRKVDNQFGLMPVGVVHVQFTIHSDGTIDTKVLEGDNATMQLLLTVSLDSIRENAPFDPFTPTLKKEIADEEHNDGESYTDDFSFSIYGGGG